MESEYSLSSWSNDRSGLSTYVLCIRVYKLDARVVRTTREILDFIQFCNKEIKKNIVHKYALVYSHHIRRSGGNRLYLKNGLSDSNFLFHYMFNMFSISH